MLQEVQLSATGDHAGNAYNVILMLYHGEVADVKNIGFRLHTLADQVHPFRVGRILADTRIDVWIGVMQQPSNFFRGIPGSGGSAEKVRSLHGDTSRQGWCAFDKWDNWAAA